VNVNHEYRCVLLSAAKKKEGGGSVGWRLEVRLPLKLFFCALIFNVGERELK